MDLKQIGMFLAQLRKEQGLTQEQLGEKLSVTNKTVSRWENGNYLPPVEMLQMLSQLYGVTINEILSAQRLKPEEYQKKAEENLKEIVESSPFSLDEKIAYYKRKWKKDHFAIGLLARILICGLLCAGFLTKNLLWTIAYVAANVIYSGFERNEMMKYVEERAFDGSGRQ